MKLLINKKTGAVFAYNEVMAQEKNVRLMTSGEMKERGITPKGEVSSATGQRIELPENFNDLPKAALNQFVVENRLKSSLNVDRKVEQLRDEVVDLVREYNAEFTDSAMEYPDCLPDDFFTYSVAKLRKFAKAPGDHLSPVSLSGITKKSTIIDVIVADLKYQERNEPAPMRVGPSKDDGV